VKLTDFGLGKRLNSDVNISTFCVMSESLDCWILVTFRRLQISHKSHRFQNTSRSSDMSHNSRKS
jgi:hypothetical protein